MHNLFHTCIAFQAIAMKAIQESDVIFTFLLLMKHQFDNYYVCGVGN